MGSINDKRMSLYLFKPRNIVANKLNSNIFRTGLFNSLYYFYNKNNNNNNVKRCMRVQ